MATVPVLAGKDACPHGWPDGSGQHGSESPSPMTTPLRLLILEDQPADAELMVRHLEQAGFAPRWQRVETEREFSAALGPEVELILADFHLPHYDALRALQRVRQCGLETPFLIVSATIGEELAVVAMQQGAADFVIKDRMARLGPAVRQALDQHRTRKSLQQFEQLSRRIFVAANELAKLAPQYEQLSALARTLAITPEQLAAVEAADAPVREYLESRLNELLDAFNQFAATGAARSDTLTTTGSAAALLAAVQDTVSVLEQTKRSFKSHALGSLRERLNAMLRAQSAS